VVVIVVVFCPILQKKLERGDASASDIDTVQSNRTIIMRGAFVAFDSACLTLTLKLMRRNETKKNVKSGDETRRRASDGSAAGT
jgi:hypothetical protein